MKQILFATFIIVVAFACRVKYNKTVKGNGNVQTESRNFSDLSKIKIRGGINVELVPGNASLKVEADENLMRYIETRDENGWLVIKTKDDTNIKSDNPIKVYISTNDLSDINIAGSGNVKGDGKFTGSNRLHVHIAGSGDVRLAVNTPDVKVEIRGSGSVSLSGETQNARVDIAGSGDYLAEELLTENTDVDIKGSGDAKIHADNTINAKILGSGSVYYRGKATVNTNTAGSGKVKPL